MAELIRATLPNLSPSLVMSFVDDAKDWLLDAGVLILVTILLALFARWALHRLIKRTVATMTARSTQRGAETDSKGNILATTTGLSGERQRARVETVGSLLRSG